MTRVVENLEMELHHFFEKQEAQKASCFFVTTFNGVDVLQGASSVTGISSTIYLFSQNGIVFCAFRVYNDNIPVLKTIYIDRAYRGKGYFQTAIDFLLSKNQSVTLDYTQSMSTVRALSKLKGVKLEWCSWDFLEHEEWSAISDHYSRKYPTGWIVKISRQ